MNAIWLRIDNLKFSLEVKIKLFIFIMTIIMVILGGIVWMLVGHIFLPGVVWLICFMGYSGVGFGMFGSVIYLYNRILK